MAGGGGGGGNFMLEGFLKLLQQQTQQQRNRGFSGIGSGPDPNFPQNINQSFLGTGNQNQIPSGSFRGSAAGANFNRSMGSPNAFQNLNAFGGPGRVIGGRSRTLPGSQINYAAINAFNQLPYNQQQFLAQRGLAPSFSDFTITGPGGTFGRRNGQTLGGIGNKQNLGIPFGLPSSSAFRSTISTFPSSSPISGNVTQNLDAIINRLGRVNQSTISNKVHRNNLNTQAGLEQLRQRAAASGNLDRFGQIAANFLGSAEQGRRNAISDQINTQTSQLLQALGLKTDLMARLAQAVAAAQPGTNSFLGLL